MPQVNQNNSVVPFRAKHHQPEKASPETAKAAFKAMRADIGDDPMSRIWDDKLNSTQKNGLLVVAGVDRELAWSSLTPWRRLTTVEQDKLRGVISTFAGLAVRIKGAL
ncbi:MAG: hypothetical protein KBT88_03555 [Gammaproteobacteria bacterium]|nr:hypothetical protein [Gammaproteobacteria bacterium]MBQ0838837.1 hypothetical protein [Gammaproteobacteria bacterium]